MSWLLTGLLCIALVELALRLPFGEAVMDAHRCGRRAVRIVFARSISDHWKERALAAYARTTFLTSIRLAGLLLALLGAAAGLVVLLEQISPTFRSFILDWRNVGFSFLVAGLYLRVRRSLVNGPLQSS